MKKYWLRLFLILLAGAFVLSPAGTLFVWADMNVRSAILIDADTRRILYQQNPDMPIPPASLTKILSMYVVMDQIRNGKASLSDKVRVSRAAARQGGSRMYLKVGERVTLDRLLMGMAVSSGNDASVAAAEHVAGSQSNFVRLMNAKMRQLGLKRSIFKNANGLPAQGQVTTAREMAFLASRYLKSNPAVLRYHKTRAIRHNGVVTTNKNPLLKTCTGADGLKTGWVTASGYNIISTVKRGKTRLLAVILGAPSSSVRAREVSRLVEAGFDSKKNGTSVAVLLTKKSSGSHMTTQSGNHQRKMTSASSSRKKSQAVQSGRQKKKQSVRTSRTRQTSRTEAVADTGSHPSSARKASSADPAGEWSVSGTLAPTGSALPRKAVSRTPPSGKVHAARTAQRS